jgi:hypothetical protein
VFDSRLRKVGGPVGLFISRYYVREPDGLLVAGTSLSLPAGPGGADVDLLVPARYDVTATPGVHALIDGMVATPSTMWLSRGPHRISWSGGPGTLRLSIATCAQRRA